MNGLAEKLVLTVFDYFDQTRCTPCTKICNGFNLVMNRTSKDHQNPNVKFFKKKLHNKMLKKLPE